MKKLTVVLLTLIMIAVVGVGVSAAQTETPTAPTTPDATAQPHHIGAALRQGEMFDGSQRPLLKSILDATHLTHADLLADVRGGKTLSDVITENGGNVDTIIAQAVAAETVKINTAVTNGKLTQDKADKLIAALQPLYESVVSGKWQQQMVYDRVRAGLVLLAAQETGLKPEDVMSQVKDGASLADVLTAHNVDVTKFIDDAVTRIQARLNVLVVDGSITQQQADEDLQKFRTALTDRINKAGGNATATPEMTETNAA